MAAMGQPAPELHAEQEETSCCAAQGVLSALLPVQVSVEWLTTELHDVQTTFLKTIPQMKCHCVTKTCLSLNCPCCS